MKQATHIVLATVMAASAACRARDEKPSETAKPAASARVEDADVASRPGRPSSRAPVIWLGLDGLDWTLLDRLAAEGRMPNWSRLVSEGSSARLAVPPPLLSPLLWTTAATGVTPDVHQVLDFQEVDPKTGRKVPISGRSRAVPAAWNLASAAGRKVGVVGWWATHPAEEVNGFFVSDRASPLLFERGSFAGVAFPTGLESGVSAVVEREGRVTAADVAQFVDAHQHEVAKALSESERSAGRTRHPIASLARVVGATRVAHRIARDLYDRERPELLALYFEGTDEVGHVFATYTPPKLDCAPEAEFARYSRVVDGYYSMVDRILGQWMRRAKEDGATLLVHSDHGFKWGPDRPCGFGAASWTTAAFWHRPEGVLAVWGAKAKPSQRRDDAHLLDVAPTVLALLGVAPDAAMQGRALSRAVADSGPPARDGAFAQVAVRRVAATEVAAEKADEYAMKLIALGYLSPSDVRPLAPTGGDRPARTEGAWNNLGVYLRDSRRDFPAARDAFEKALQLRPDYYSALFNLAVLERMRGDAKSAEKWFFRSVVAVGGDPAPAVLTWASEAERSGDAAAARSALEKGHHSHPANEEIARALAHARYRADDCRGATDVLGRFEETTRSARTLNSLALFEACRKDRAAVIRLLRRSLALDPNQPDVARSLQTAESGG